MKLRAWYDVVLFWEIVGPLDAALTVKAVAQNLDSLTVEECDLLMDHVADHLQTSGLCFDDDWECTPYGLRVESLIDAIVSSRIEALDRLEPTG